jgi:hypothetical protein
VITEDDVQKVIGHFAHQTKEYWEKEALKRNLNPLVQYLVDGKTDQISIFEPGIDEDFYG